MLGAGLSVSAVALRRGGGGAGSAPDWPEDAVALWLILGQSNAVGFTPWEQDPARLDPADAVPNLTPEERAVHPWIRFSYMGSEPALMGRFAAGGHGLATETSPRTSGHVWQAGNDYGIPAGTECYGPEIALHRHVLSGAVPAWRDDAAPRLYVFKQAQGSCSVDFFRWGGEGQHLVADALRQTLGENLDTLAAAKTVLLQGIIFAIGDKDANDPEPGGGGTMANTLEVRFADWVRQLRAALGGDLPVAFVELEDTDARKVIGNAQIEALAASLPNAAVIHRTPAWTDVGDGLHYDGAGMDEMGRAFFSHFRDEYGRGGDGLVTGHVFTGLKPWFHVPPQFVDESSTQMRIACTPAADGVMHARIGAPGAPAPSPETIRDQSGQPGGFFRAVTRDEEAVFWSFNEFDSQTLQDVHFVLEAPDGTLGEAVTVERPDLVRFGPDLSVGPVTAATAQASLKPSFTGTLTWSLFEGARDHIRREDVEAKAFGPVQWGQLACTANLTSAWTLSGLSAATEHTLFITGERASDGRKGLLQKAGFTTA